MSQQPFAFPKVETYDYALFGDVEVRPLNNIRKIIARRLWAAWANVPQVTQFDEVDVTALEALRRDLKPKAAAANVKLTILAFLIKASIRALQAFPEFNASLDDSGENLIVKKYCNIAFAADTPAGLLAPVIKNADRKSLFELAAAADELARKAREGRLAFSDCEGGCFSISNLGELGGTGFTPTINAPEVAVLGVGCARRKVVVVDDTFAARLMLPLTLTYDHRVIDGAVGGRFMQTLRQALATPESLAD
jgi:pyruvate dehydrogenase E2 component (dihydrolipoamide acetyltransferase)